MRLKRPLGAPWVQIVAGTLFVAGVALGLSVEPLLFILAAVGAFMPDLLRCIGILRDFDGFQNLAATAAARLAVILSGFYVAIVTVAAASGRIPEERVRDVLLTVFILLSVTRFVAYQVRFWNPLKAAPRIFIVFGAFWSVFVALSEFGNWTALLLETLVVVAPFAAGAVLVRRFPRVVGSICLVLSVGAFVFFNLHRLFVGNLGALIVFLLIPSPLIVVGVGMLTVETEEEK